MFKAIGEIIARFDPPAVFVYQTCVPALIGDDLEAVAKAHPTMSLGSYPFFSDGVVGSNLVLRGRDPEELAATVQELIGALSAAGVVNVREMDGGDKPVA